MRALAMVTALVLSGGAATAAVRDDERVSDPPRDAQAPVAGVDAEQARFGVLRRPAAESDRLPAAAAAFLRDNVTGETGAAPALARRALATGGGLAVYVIPARGRLCQYVMDSRAGTGHGGCAPTGSAARGYLLAAESPAPGVARVTGLVPDGVTEVRLRAVDGSTETATVRDNAYAFETLRAPAQVEFAGRVVTVAMR